MHGGLAVVMAVGDVLEEQVDLLAGDDIADVVGLRELAEDHADHLAIDQRGAAAVARVDGGVNLDADARDVLVVAGELDARDDPLGDREGRAALGIPVGQYGLLDLGQGLGARHGGPLVEERLVLEPEHGQVDARAHRHDPGRELVARLVTLDEELTGVCNHVGISEDALALDDHARATGLAGAVLGPGLGQVGEPHRGGDLHDRVADLRLRRVVIGRGRRGRARCAKAPIRTRAGAMTAAADRPTEIIRGVFIAWTRSSLPDTLTETSTHLISPRAGWKVRGSRVA